MINCGSYRDLKLAEHTIKTLEKVLGEEICGECG